MTTNKLDPVKPGTKLAALADALQTGSDLSALSELLSWQPHTVRAALTRLRQRGYRIDLKEGVYSVKPARGKKS
jgi:predicted transcriptional regulator of viral defense system